jgi:putative ABC transport system substrate-binding protein
MRETEAAARTLGVQLQSLEVRGPDDFENVLPTAMNRGAGALFVVDDPLVFSFRMRIADFAVRNRLPATAIFREFAEAGGLMTFGANLVDLSRRAAMYVDKILKGTRPADLPVEQPTKLDLVINLKTAKALGLTIPPSLLQRADEVIQ